jgi:hypothetical protein
MKWLRKIIWLIISGYALLGLIGVGFELLSQLGINANGGELLRFIIGGATIVSLVGWVPLLAITGVISLVDSVLSYMKVPQRMLCDARIYVATGLLALLPTSFFLTHDYVRFHLILVVMIVMVWIGFQGLIKPISQDPFESQKHFWYEMFLSGFILWGILPLIFGMYSRNVFTSIWMVMGVGVTVLVLMFKPSQLSLVRVLMTGIFLAYVGWVSVDRFILRMSWEQVSSCEEYPLYLSEGFGSWMGSSYFWYTPSPVPGLLRFEGRSEESQTQRFVVQQFGEQYPSCVGVKYLPNPGMY